MDAPTDMEKLDSEAVERLGRQRPKVFKSAASEWGFCFSVFMSQLLTDYFVSGFPVIVPKLADALQIPEDSQVWPASVFSLVISSYLLVFGRAGDAYGGKKVYLAGTAWLFVFALASGFSPNLPVLTATRALAGLGPAAYLPTSLMQLGSIYRPGPRMNLIFGIYGACAPLGFFLGIFVAAAAEQRNSWPIYFWVGSAMAALTTAAGYLCIPRDESIRQDGSSGVKMDWTGSLLVSSGLLLTVFAVVDSAHAPQGWKTPYILATFVVGVLLLLVAVYVEGFYLPSRTQVQPLLPPDLFRVKGMTPFLGGLFLFYSGMGIFWFYSTFYMRDIMGGSPLQIAAWFLPSALGGLVVGPVTGLLLHILSSRIIIISAGVAWVVAPLLFALMPIGASYWAWVFPSMICTTLAIEPTFSIANVFISRSLSLDLQGLAGGVSISLLQLSIALFLGLTDLIVVGTADQGKAKSYKNAFWFQTALAVVSLLVMVLVVHIPKADSQKTVDEVKADQEDSTSSTGSIEVVEVCKSSIVVTL